MGKFTDRIAERFYSLSLESGHDEECGDCCDYGAWFGLFRMRRADVILSEDSNGFVDAAIIGKGESDGLWAGILDDYAQWFEVGDSLAQT